MVPSNVNKLTAVLDALGYTLSHNTGAKCTAHFVSFESAPYTVTTVHEHITVLTVEFITIRDLLQQCAQWHACPLEVPHLVIACRSADQFTAVRCAPGFHFVAQLRCTVQCYFCALYKRTVQPD